MKLFGPLYARVMAWSTHRRAPALLGGLSFAESSFFPIPPDVMLMPMALANPQRAWFLAALTTVTSVLGGLLGYLIGAFFFDAIQPWLSTTHYWTAFEKTEQAFAQYGFWFVLVAGFSPIPYKVFTIASGALGMPLLPFVLGSIVGRGGRFFLVAGLIRAGGEKAAAHIERNVEFLGWIVVALVVVAGIYLKLR